MIYSSPANLGVIACPGSESFADEMLSHLKNGYRRIFNNMTEEFSKRYKQKNEEILSRINFINDVINSPTNFQQAVEKVRIPKIKIPARFTCFANGEIKAEILESIRGRDIYIVQDVENRYPINFNNGELIKSFSINDHLMTLFVTVDAAKSAGAGRITLVLPVYPYSRQHRSKGREGVTAGRLGKNFEALGVDRIITLDIHSREIANTFNFMRLENLHASYQITRALLTHLPGILSDDFVVVSPDTGAVDRNKFYANALKKNLALLYKERNYERVTRDAADNNISEVRLLGDVRDKTVFMADDMLGTGGTLLNAMKFLKSQGAGKVICAISLPIFSGNAINHFDEAYKEGLFYRIIGTNAVYHEELLKREWYINVNITRLFAKTITRLHHGLSLSSILDNRSIIVKLLSESPSTAS